MNAFTSDKGSASSQLQKDKELIESVLPSLEEAKAEASAYLKSMYKKQDRFNKEEAEKLVLELNNTEGDYRFTLAQELKGGEKTEGNPWGVGDNFVRIERKDAWKKHITPDESIIKDVKNIISKDGWIITKDGKSDQGTWIIYFKRK